MPTAPPSGERMAFRWLSGSVCATLLAIPVLVPAEEPAAVDADFLEFLGSLDSDDEAWAALLTGSELRKASTAKQDDPESKPKQVDP
jgi:hypothetical protein